MHLRKHTVLCDDDKPQTIRECGDRKGCITSYLAEQILHITWQALLRPGILPKSDHVMHKMQQLPVEFIGENFVVAGDGCCLYHLRRKPGTHQPQIPGFVIILQPGGTCGDDTVFRVPLHARKQIHNSQTMKIVAHLDKSRQCFT